MARFTTRSALRRLLMPIVVIVLVLVVPVPANAYAPVNIVHTERIQVGPYGMTIGFSEWPLHAMQSLDFTFIPDGGIADKRGTIQRIAPSGTVSKRPQPLARHPRKRDVWGLDVASLAAQGDWTFRFELDGPLGHGSGALRHLHVLEQPGPPLVLSWSITTLPLIALVAGIGFAWWRVRPGRHPETWQYV